METKRAVELLIQEVEKIPYLKTLPFSNDEFRLWLKNVENIINTGLEQEDKQEFQEASQFLRYIRYEDDLKQQDYIDEIIRYEIALKSIIQRYEILGIVGEGDKGGEVEMMDDKEKIIDELKDFYKNLRRYENRQRRRDKGGFTQAQDRSLNALRLELQREYGRLGNTISQYGGRVGVQISGGYTDAFHVALQSLNMEVWDFDALDGAIGLVNKTIGKLESTPIAELEESRRDREAQTPKAFIAHGGDSPTLRKLKNYLDALGVQPLVVEEQPSEGRSIAENVDYYARQADFAIILATKGDIDGKTGGFIPRGNVLIEIGKSQELFKERIIYLLQAGTKFPTNISEKVWGRFTTERMDDAFIKIARELCKFGILHAVKPLSKENPH